MSPLSVLLVVFLVVVRNANCNSDSTGHSLHEVTTRLNVHDISYDIARRLNETVSSFLQISATKPSQTTQLQSLFRARAWSLLDIQSLLFTQITSSDLAIGAVHISYMNGTMMGFKREAGQIFYMTTQPSRISCGPDDTIDTSTSQCLQIFRVDGFGRPTFQHSAITIDLPTASPSRWTAATSGIFTRTTINDGVAPGVAFSVPLLGPSDQSPCVASTIHLFSSLRLSIAKILQFNDDDFSSSVSQSIRSYLSKEIRVLVTDTDWSLLASVNQTDAGVTVNINASLSDYWRDAPASALESSDLRIQHAIEFVMDLRSDDQSKDSDHPFSLRRYIHDGMSIQPLFLCLPSLDLEWHIVYIRVEEIEDTDLGLKSPINVVLMTFASFGVIATFSIMGWIARFRALRIWVFSFPPVLFVMLVSHLICHLFVFANSIHTTNASCVLRSWALVVGLIVSGTTTAHLTLLTSAQVNLLGVRSRKLKMLLVSMYSLVILEMLVLLAESCVGNIHAHNFYTASESHFALRHECEHEHPAWLGVKSGIPILVLLVAAIPAFSTSKSVIFLGGGRRGLVITSVNCLLLFFLFVLVHVSRAMTGTEFTWAKDATSIGMLIYVYSAQMLIFGLRIYRQVAGGDITLNEMREAVVDYSRKTAATSTTPTSNTGLLTQKSNSNKPIPVTSHIAKTPIPESDWHPDAMMYI